MNKRTNTIYRKRRNLKMERLIVLVNGLAGFVCGVCLGIMIFLLLLVGFHYEAQTIIGMYFEFFGPQVILGILGFWFAVRGDWWRMKREW